MKSCRCSNVHLLLWNENAFMSYVAICYLHCNCWQRGQEWFNRSFSIPGIWPQVTPTHIWAASSNLLLLLPCGHNYQCLRKFTLSPLNKPEKNIKTIQPGRVLVRFNGRAIESVVTGVISRSQILLLYSDSFLQMNEQECSTSHCFIIKLPQSQVHCVFFVFFYRDLQRDSNKLWRTLTLLCHAL